MHRYLDKLIEMLLAVLMSGMIVVVTVQVFYRYVLKSPLGWTEEIAGFTLVWTSFLGSYIAFRRGSHLRIELLYLLIPNRGKRAFLILSDLLVSGFALFLILRGVPFAKRFMYMLSPNLQFPLGISYMVVPVTGILFLIHLLPEVYQLLVRPNEELLLKGTSKEAEEAKRMSVEEGG